MLVLCEEFACGFQLVTHYAEKFLALLKDVQVDERCFVVGCARPPLHTIDVCLAQGRELFFAEFGLLEHSFFVVEAASGEHLASLVHQIADAVADGAELFHKGRRYGVEVVVDMLLYRLEQPLQAVDELLVAVGAKMEPGVVFQRDVLGNAVQGDKLTVAHPFQLFLLVFQQLLRGAQPFKVLRRQTVEDAVVLFGGETAGVALRVADMWGVL